jgi:hypothetical protein
MAIGGYTMPQMGIPSDYAQRPLNRIPPPAPPIFAPQPQQQTPQKQGEASPIEQIPQMQMPPIFAAQRKQVDLSKLRAAFKPPVFSNRG